VIEQSIPHSRLVAHRAREARPALEAYFRMVMEANPALIGGRMPPEDFFL
jgi:NitT/TauT family transport system substrate-binding protein